MSAQEASAARDWRLPACLAIIYVVWGSTYLAIRVMVRSIPPLLGAGARFLLAGLILGLVVTLRQRPTLVGTSLREGLNAALVGLLILVGGVGLVTVAEQRVPSALTALVIASIPLWIVLLRAIHREAINGMTVAAVGLGFIGLAVLLRPGEAPEAPSGSLALLLLAAILTAIGAFYSKKMRLPAHAFVGTAIEMLAAGTILLLAGLFLGELGDFSTAQISSESALAFIYLVIAGSLVAYSAFVWLLGNAPVSTVGTYAYVNPLVAVILGVLILRETISATLAVGAAIIVLSVVFVVQSEKKGGAGQAHQESQSHPRRSRR